MRTMGTDQDQSFIVLDNPPEDMIAFVETDLSGVSVARRCPELCLVPLFLFLYFSLTKKKNSQFDKRTV